MFGRSVEIMLVNSTNCLIGGSAGRVSGMGGFLRGVLPLAFVAFLGGQVLPVLAQEVPALPDVNADADLVARGIVRPASRVRVHSAIEGRIMTMPLKPGERFEKGDELYSLDCNRIQAELKAAKAEANAACIEHATKQRLYKFQAAGKDEVKQASARASAASAIAEIREANVSECVYQAPFSGRIVATAAQPGEFPAPGEPLLVIVDDSNVELELVVPSHWLSWVAPGNQLVFTIDETGARMEARLDRIGAEVDPVSQTITVYARAITVPEGTLAGMSGTAIFAGQM
jgi:RND family efflux transporter MFP subunit